MRRVINQKKIFFEYKEKYNNEVDKIKKIPKIPKFETIHIGSTSIVNSIGEDIVDILLIVDNLHDITNFDEKRLNNINYHRISHNQKNIIIYCKITKFLEISYDTKIFIVQKNTKTYNQFIQFHNLLKNNEKVFKEYQDFKKENLNNKILNKKIYNEKQSIFIKKHINEEKND